METHSVIDTLLRAISHHHRTRPDRYQRPMLEEVIEALDAAVGPRAVEPHVLPVVEHLGDVEPGSGPAQEVLRELLALSHLLPWRRTVGYFDVLPEQYMENYGYVQLVGPGSLVEHPAVRVGIGVWGPDLVYPMHHHEAEELYDVISGSPWFRHADGPWTQVATGQSFHCSPWRAHELSFPSTPTVVLYAWTGAVSADAVLVG